MAATGYGAGIFVETAYGGTDVALTQVLGKAASVFGGLAGLYFTLCGLSDLIDMTHRAEIESQFETYPPPLGVDVPDAGVP